MVPVPGARRHVEVCTITDEEQARFCGVGARTWASSRFMLGELLAMAAAPPPATGNVAQEGTDPGDVDEIDLCSAVSGRVIEIGVGAHS